MSLIIRIFRRKPQPFPKFSIGCRSTFNTCSICGHQAKTLEDRCEHLRGSDASGPLCPASSSNGNLYLTYGVPLKKGDIVEVKDTADESRSGRYRIARLGRRDGSVELEKVESYAIPQDMIWTVYRNFVMRRLIDQGLSDLEAKEAIDTRNEVAADALTLVMEERPVDPLGGKEAAYRAASRKKATILACVAAVTGIMGCFASPGVDLIVFGAANIEAIFAIYWAKRSRENG